MWEQKRSYVRVHDQFVVLPKKVEDEGQSKKSRVLTEYYTGGYHGESREKLQETDLPKLLSEINGKLNLILNKLYLENEGFVKGKEQHVNISASGMHVNLAEKVSLGDIVEVKMVLPIYPHDWIRVCGKVSRLQEKQDGTFDAALEFIDMTDEVRDMITFYTLNRQREIRRERKARQETGGEQQG